MGALDYSSEKLQKQYNTSAREAYVNKILSTNNLKYKLNELGLATSGAGIDQYYDLENSYGKNLAILGSTLGEGLADIEQQRREGLSDYNAGLSNLDLKYSQLEQAAKSDIFDRLEAYKKNEYNNQTIAELSSDDSTLNEPIFLLNGVSLPGSPNAKGAEESYPYEYRSEQFFNGSQWSNWSEPITIAK